MQRPSVALGGLGGLVVKFGDAGEPADEVVGLGDRGAVGQCCTGCRVADLTQGDCVKVGRVVGEQDLVAWPLNPNSDYHRWKALLKTAGVRDGRLHDARYTAATVLLVLGVPERSVMGIMGWSSTAMAARYQHVTNPIRRTVAAQVGGLLVPRARGLGMPNETKTETTAPLAPG